jgi:[histone H3]-lysine36 N-dimethyltransferase SETMAR
MEKENLRFYIQTRTILGVTPIAIHEELVSAHGPEVISYSSVQKWAKLFNEGRIELEDNPRPGRPVSVTTKENIEEVQRLIEEDPHCTYDEIEAATELSRGIIYTIIHDHLKLQKVISRWVPHQLTLEQKQERVRICQENLTKFRNNSWKLCNIITGDETWIYYRQVGKKASNAYWIGEGQTPQTVVRRDRYEPKMLYSIFFKSNGALWVHSVGKGQTVDNIYYINNCLRPVIEEVRKQRPKSGTKGIKLLHDNAQPHNHENVLNYLDQEGVNLMPHPRYSPDLSPCDFWLFDYIKSNLEDYNDEKSLFKAVSKIVFSIPDQEYKKTFDRLLDRMQLCINNNGEYFEHLM